MVQQTLSYKRLLRSEKIRFILVGIVNTVTDFVVLLVLAEFLGIPVMVSNVISTSSAMAVSYTLNKKAVFGNTDRHNHRQVLLFIAVTLAGLWIVQSVVIIGVTNLLNVSLHEVNSAVVLIIAKMIATVFSLLWNYLWYSRVVFRKGKA